MTIDFDKNVYTKQSANGLVHYAKDMAPKVNNFATSKNSVADDNQRYQKMQNKLKDPIQFG